MIPITGVPLCNKEISVPNKGLPVIKLRVPSEKFRLGKAEERDRSAHEMTFPAYQSDPIPYEIQVRQDGRVRKSARST